jgi:hypothetical protein
LDRVSFLSFKNPSPPFGMPEEPSRAGSMFGQPSERRRFYRRNSADMDPSIHVVRSATTLAPLAIHLQALIVQLMVALRGLQIGGIQQEDG